MTTTIQKQALPLRTIWVFAAYWAIAFLIYLPAAKAGLVADFPGWVHQLRSLSLPDFINRKWSYIPGLYQGTGLVTWLLFQLCGTHAWPWHLVAISLHALNGALICLFMHRLSRDAAISNSRAISIWSGLLFVITPYASEAVVWEPAFHYLQAVALMLGMLLLVLRFQHSGSMRIAVSAALLFAFTIFTLELFYITPVLTLLIALYYRRGLAFGRGVLRRTVYGMLLPQLALLCLHVCLMRRTYGATLSRSDGSFLMHPLSFVINPAKSVFHLLLYGSFWPQSRREQAYRIIDGKVFMPAVWLTLMLVTTLIAFRWSRMNSASRLRSLLLAMSGCGLALTIPLAFDEHSHLACSRYLYLPAAFVYPLLCLLIFSINCAMLRQACLAACAGLSIALSLKLSSTWRESAKIVEKIVAHHPDFTGKTVVMLNNPRDLDGAPMIMADEPSALKNLCAIGPRPVNDTVYEVADYNMNSPADGAHVRVRNDSVLTVTLNQWGSWWMRAGRGAQSFGNAWFTLSMTDAGHEYELILHRPADRYVLMYQRGDEWKAVDMRLRDADQY